MERLLKEKNKYDPGISIKKDPITFGKRGGFFRLVERKGGSARITLSRAVKKVNACAQGMRKRERSGTGLSFRQVGTRETQPLTFAQGNWATR